MSDRHGRATPSTAPDDDELARLLRVAGPRVEAPVDRSARVRRSVHQYWRADTRRRARRHWIWASLALVSTAALVSLVIRIGLPSMAPVPAAAAIVARVERLDGVVKAWPEGASLADARTLAPETGVHADEWVTTGAKGRVALRVTNGVSLRLDVGSRARLSSAMVIELEEGALYVDTGREVTGLEVRTALGTARDIGTQFEVRVRDSALRVRVRTGVVEPWRDDRPISARPGTEVRVTDGEIVSSAVSPFGPAWDWVAGIAPALEFDGRPLASFLEGISREHGWTVHYADTALEREAGDIILSGPVTGLTPHEALEVAVASSGFVHQLQDGEVVVARTAMGDDPEGRP